MTMIPMALVTFRKDLTNEQFNKAAQDIKAVRGVHTCTAVNEDLSGNKSLTVTFDGSLITQGRIWLVPGVYSVTQPRI